MKNTVFTGAATAIITPFKNNKVDYECFARLIDWQIAEGIDAIVVCGTTGEGSTLSDEEHREVLKFAVSGKNGCISLPSLTKAVFTDGVLTFEPDKTEKDAAESYEFPLSEGFNIINGTLFAVCITKCGCNQPIIDVNYSLYASADLKGEHNELYARNRRAGDAILDGGVHKKLKKLMCDKKVPLSDRDTLPLIISREAIIYTPLCAISDIARAKKAEREFNISIYKLKQKIQSNLSQE